MPEVVFRVEDQAGNRASIIFTATVPAPSVWPAMSSWPTKEAWIEARAGVKTTNLRTVGVDTFWVNAQGQSQKVPQGCRWVNVNGRWNLYVDTATVLEDIWVPGTIVPRGTSGPDITLRNVFADDCFTWEAKRIKVVEDCEFVIPAERVHGGYGQGCLNAMANGFTVRRTVLRGGADGMQCGGGGLVEECVIRDLTVGPTSHCDFIQNYSGLVTINRTVMRQALKVGESDHLNGLFADRGSGSPAPGTYIVRDSSIVVTAPPGVNGWAVNATPTKGGWVDIANSRLVGRTVGDVRIGVNVERV